MKKNEIKAIREILERDEETFNKRITTLEEDNKTLWKKVKELDTYSTNLTKFIDKDRVICERQNVVIDKYFTTRLEFVFTFVYNDCLRQVTIGWPDRAANEIITHSVLKNDSETLMLKFESSLYEHPFYYLIEKNGCIVKDITAAGDLIKE